ncbi:MAG: hypothetical protein LBH62_00810 [Nitrososphaerota archaeon]|jgi:hypothetical protein|uniref:hypothetical protein n=1 Tax=Candidatus Bathycorpusculum sp. TaxID=2994959 RepID=UPI0028324282|nr:hypothetical protein [Candidatus Termiticorpusculum sp.]MCL2257226.1 hypothetical protein [Candidatus Termiticorpusculum sp.]MCL2292624.1 hypothetical protein [Candidatus Termiticorpusculum sp.]MDR0459972.1 hypothetical protein [Nitrososphaerota archaeon]
MTSSKERLEQLSDEAKRTTLILEKAERDFIDRLIRDGKESGIKPLISKMLDIYRSLMIYGWTFPGEYYYGISRVAFVNIELINFLIQNTPKEKWYDTGKKMGNILKVSMDATIGIDSFKQENWEDVFKRLCLQGFGYFSVKDKYLLLKNPFLNESLLWEGIIEGLFGIKVETKTFISPLVFEIKPPV